MDVNEITNRDLENALLLSPSSEKLVNNNDGSNNEEERVVLVVYENGNNNNNNNNNDNEWDDKIVGKTEVVREVKKQVELAGPLVSVNFLVFSLQLISTMFVGHLGELPLAGASMATSFASVTGFSLLTGLASALDTFCGQSYGAKQYHMLGIHMQRSMVVLTLVSIPLAFMWANTGNILGFLGQDPEIAAEAGMYARYLIPSVFAYGLLQCHIKFLQAQNIVVPMMATAAFSTLLHMFGCWVLVFKSGLGNKGAAISSGLCYWINVLLLAAYVRLSPSCRHTWTGFSKEAFHGIPNFLRLAIPSAIMMCLEIWSFEMVVLSSGFLPNPKLETSVLSISLNTCSTIYMMPLGLGAAVSTRVSNELGAGRPKRARLEAYVSLLMVGVEGITTACVLIIGHSYWGYLYSNDEEVVKHVGEMLFLLASSHLFEGIQTVLLGIVDGNYSSFGCTSIISLYHCAKNQMGSASRECNRSHTKCTSSLGINVVNLVVHQLMSAFEIILIIKRVLVQCFVAEITVQRMQVMIESSSFSTYGKERSRSS